MKALIACIFLALSIPLAGCGNASPTNCSTDSVSDVGEGPLMEPGGACIDCHSSGEGPRFTIAGTVMAKTDDDTGCNGVNAATIEITDANGAVVILTANSAGNFYLNKGSVALPYTAVVKANGQERAMSGAQSVGDCNSCHTAAGANGAPGRILSPG